jgi:hypothetical protein
MRRADWRKNVTSLLVQPRSVAIRLGETNWLSRLIARLVRRWRRPLVDRVPDYLLRDAGLERIVGVIGRRPR